nr:MAG TPA: hypothetical protein [Caudoviricetes sp.]
MDKKIVNWSLMDRFLRIYYKTIRVKKYVLNISAFLFLIDYPNLSTIKLSRN